MIDEMIERIEISRYAAEMVGVKCELERFEGKIEALTELKEKLSKFSA